MPRAIVAFLLLHSLLFVGIVHAEQATVRSVTGGQVQGIVVSDSDYAGPDLEVYKGIPYAAPPVGDLRWRPPQAVTPWNGVLKTDNYGATCPQTRDLRKILDTMVEGQGMSWLRTKLTLWLIGLAPERPMSEDCLTINVWTQKGASEQELKPVMVWLHGGGHIAGSASDGLYEGDLLARKGVVLVTMNYRLGILGYMAHEGLSDEAEAEQRPRSSGNYGTLDQIAALQWVQDNITAFGGNPDKVTIFGESAGGHSVGQLMASPLARGLFHRAIAQSGLGSHNLLRLSDPVPARNPAEYSGQEIAKAAGVAAAEDPVQALRSVTVEQLLEISSQRQDLMDYLHPNVDGWVLPKSVAEIFAAGEQADVPLLIGSNADEGTLFSIFDMPPFHWRTEVPRTVAELDALLSEEFGANDARLLMAHYGVKQDENVASAVLNIWGDVYFGAQALFAARQMENVESPAYLYFFKQTPPSDKQILGATHSAEIPFVFGSGIPLFPANDSDEMLTDIMSTYWVNFAKAGLPIAKGQPAWPQFVADQPRWMEFKHGARVTPIERSMLYDIYLRRQQALLTDVKKSLGHGVQTASSESATQ